MQVTVEYAAQVKQAAGVRTETVDIDDGCSAQDVVARVAESHGDPLKGLLLDGEGQLQRSILLFVRGEQVRWETPAPLNDRDVVTILSPISGG